MKNKLLFNLDIPFHETITVFADNERDLENYLLGELLYHTVEFFEDYVLIKNNAWDTSEMAELKWIKQI